MTVRWLMAGGRLQAFAPRGRIVPGIWAVYHPWKQEMRVVVRSMLLCRGGFVNMMLVEAGCRRLPRRRLPMGREWAALRRWVALSQDGGARLKA